MPRDPALFRVRNPGLEKVQLGLLTHSRKSQGDLHVAKGELDVAIEFHSGDLSVQ